MKATASNQLWDLLRESIGTGFIENPKLHASIRRLSGLFTEERDDLGEYFADPELKRAYLGYFLPLNFTKVRFILDLYRMQLWPDAAPAQPRRWLDLGSGPGTAALAAMQAYAGRYKAKPPATPIHIDLVDSQPEALTVASELIARMAQKLGLKVTTATHASIPRSQETYDLTLAANVLNELPASLTGTAKREPLLELWDRTRGAMLVLEPGHRVSSQRLVRFRERLLRDAGEPAEHGARILGPCPHTERCPVYRSKHWCHFSEPIQDGRLIDLNLRVFKDPRQWMKFSYVLFARGVQPPWDKQTFRAIGDLHPSGPGSLAIDLCQPVQKRSLRVQRSLKPELKQKLVRGRLVRLDDKGRLLQKG